MKLRAQKFRLTKSGELVGTVVVLTDDGAATGIEHSGNYSKGASRELLKKVAEADGDVDMVKNQLRELLKQLREEADAAESSPPKPQSGLTVIRVNNRFLREISDQAWEVLCAANDPPFIFQRGQLLVDITIDDEGSPFLRTLKKPTFKGILDRQAAFAEITENDDLSPARPPNDVVDDMMNIGVMPLPYLLDVIESPIVSPSGSILTNPGYQHETRYYLELAGGLSIPTVSEIPNEDDIFRARELILNHLLKDFPFVSEADLANAVAVLLLPFVRLLIDGVTPLHLIESPTPGTGKRC